MGYEPPVLGFFYRAKPPIGAASGGFPTDKVCLENIR